MRKWKKYLAVLMLPFMVLPGISGGKADADTAAGTWKKGAGGYWYSYGEGRYAQNEWVKDGRKWYYLKADGYMASGWMQIGNTWYYFHPKNGDMQTGWRKVGSSWYYFKATGEMKTGWLEYRGDWYYFRSDGSMAKGETLIKGVSYNFSSDGILISSGLGNAKVGDIVTFGNYEQDNNTENGKEPIEWRVIDKKEDGSLWVISKLALDTKPYNDELRPFTWEDCSLRAWLNSEFYDAAFSSSEKLAIKTMTLKNDDNYYWGTRGGNDTVDKVFLLSWDESKQYFVDDDGTHSGGDSHDRTCDYTAYAGAQGMTPYEVGKWWDNYCWYWLRGPGQYQNYAAYVYRNGYSSLDYDGIDPYKGGVRPVIVLYP